METHPERMDSLRVTARRLGLAALLLLAACRAAAPVAEPAPAAAVPLWELENPVRPLPVPPLGVPVEFSELPFKVTPEKVRLGRWLFFDTRLSADGTVSCASCHRPENAFSEPTPVSTGVGGRTGRRKPMPILNVAFPITPSYFWDGRAGSLLEQAKGPMASRVEMDMSHERVTAAVSRIPGYRRYFREAFGDDPVDVERIAEAIAAYESTRLSGNSAYDRYEAGDDGALDERQRQGRDLFFGKARCNACHLGFNLSDSRFHNLGVGYRSPAPGSDPRAGFRDLGRYEVTRREEDTGAFKTPTLRDCRKHPPFMHDGSIATLREVVLHYDRGGTRNPWLGEEMRPLNLSAREVDALVAFLEALDGEGYQDTPPGSFPR